MTPAPTRTAAAMLVTRRRAPEHQAKAIPAAAIPAKGAGLATGTGTAAPATARNRKVQGSRSRPDDSRSGGLQRRGDSYGHDTRAGRFSSILSQESRVYGTADSDAEGRPRICLVWLREAGENGEAVERGKAWEGQTREGQQR